MSTPGAAPGEGMSKNARKRANQKARAAAEAEGAAPAPAAPAPKAKAENKPKAEAKPKAKAEAKAKAEPKAEPKAKGKAKAEPKKAEPAPQPAAKGKAKAEPKAAGKAKAKAKAEAPAPAPKKKEDAIPDSFYQEDDGSGGAWEEIGKGTKKNRDRAERKAAERAAAEEAEKQKQIEEARAAKEAEKKAKAEAKSKAKAKSEPKKDAGATIVAASVVAPTPAPEKAAEAAKDAPPPEPTFSVTLKIDASKVGRIIGPKGATLALIKEKTGVKNIDTMGDVVTVVGPEQAGVDKAAAAIKEMLDKGYMSLSFNDFKEDKVKVWDQSIPDIIGQRGATIIKIKEELKVTIDIPQDKNAPAGQKAQGKKVEISVAGEAENVEKAKEVIEGIAKHTYHELTHPGFSHTEMDVEEHKYRFIIGRGGSEMRHIQGNFHVKVTIPRQGSLSDKVLIVGETRDVERAQKYIEKILAEADKPKGRDAEGAEDAKRYRDDDEGPEEAWMKSYIIKR